jgi:hypothetical protein
MKRLILAFLIGSVYGVVRCVRSRQDCWSTAPSPMVPDGTQIDDACAEASQGAKEE